MKSFKEYMTKGFAIGGIDSVHPIKSMGDTGASKPPKGKGSRSSRAVGLVAHSVGQSFGSLKPTASLKSVEGTPLHKHMVKKGVIKKKKD
jgi:hypothetical protein